METADQASAAKGAFDFERSKRKADGQFNWPVNGFGEDGSYTLWLPSPIAFRKYVFDDQGNPKIEMGGSCLAEDPQLQRLRDELIASLGSAGPGIMTIDVSFLKYCAVVLLRNYTLSGQELTMLLQGTKWHDQMLRHLIGGDGFVEALAKNGPALIERFKTKAASPPLAYQIHSETTKPRRHRWKFWRSN